MKVILLQDVKGTGKRGDIINVSDGFARNMLFPKKLAQEASDSSVRELKQQKDKELASQAKARQEAQQLADRMKDFVVTVEAKAGENGKLFGSITNAEIAEALAAQHGIKLDRKKIEVEHIKSLGELKVEVRVYPEVTTEITVNIVAAK